MDRGRGAAETLAVHLLNHGWQSRPRGGQNTQCRLCKRSFPDRRALGVHLRNCKAYELLAAEQALRGTTLPPWEPPPRKPRPEKSPKPRAVLRLENTKKLLAQWQRKLKLATTKVKKYRAQLKRHKRLAEKVQ